MDFFSATIYGLVQGLCEFLPISSSGHLALLPSILSLKDPGIFFDLLMHVGTGIAVCIYYHKSVFQLLQSFSRMVLSFIKDRRWIPSNHADFLMVNMLIATICSVVVIVIVKDYSEQVNRNIILIGFNLIVFGFLLWAIDALIKRKVDHHFETRIDIKSSVMIGVAQAMAIFPGVSRAGITLTMSRGLGLSKTSAANFSFLLSLPIIFAGALSKGVEVIKVGVEIPALPITIYAIVLSGVVGLVTIHFFLKLIKNVSLFYFFLYRLLLGIVVWNVLL